MESPGIKEEWGLSGVPDKSGGETDQVEQRQNLENIKCYSKAREVY